uniref:Uncharacterized protein n=1 Tax=Heterorhabditis bacteriophora TaxID=37862 RepID=A0A1I7WKF1_HETBA
MLCLFNFGLYYYFVSKLCFLVPEFLLFLKYCLYNTSFIIVIH